MVFHPMLRKLAEPSFLPALAQKNEIGISFFIRSLGSRPAKTKRKTPVWAFSLFLRFFEDDALAQGRVELRELYFALSSLLVLARPDDVRRLRGLELDEANL